MLERVEGPPRVEWTASLAVMTAWLVGCGSASDAASGAFSGPLDDGGGFDSAVGVDGSSDASAPDGGDGPPATTIFINASPSLGAVRLCWSAASEPLSATAVPFPSGAPMPASNYAGIAVGGAEWLDAERTKELTRGDVTLYALDAKPLVMSHQDALPCGQLICAAGCNLKLNRAYWRVGTVPAGMVSPGRTNVIAITGCLGAGADGSATTARCGATWDSALGNLHADVVSLARFVADAGGLAVQALQLSAGVASRGADAGAAVLTFGRENEGDAAVVAQLADEAALGPPSPAVVMLPTGLAGFGQLGFSVDVARTDAGGGERLWTSLAQAQSLVIPALDPTTYYGVSGTYVVAIVGDPNTLGPAGAANDAGYDGTGLHVLVLPPDNPIR